MRSVSPFDFEALDLQIRRQRKHAWDLETSIPWTTPIDISKKLLPLDHDAIAFPGASQEQRLALSQLSGLIINSTISEMENVIHLMRNTGWEKILQKYPVNPEMWELGDLFFIEEQKHARAFERYNQLFAKAMGLSEEDLMRILPRAYGSWFLKAISMNASLGGHAFWWVVASVEEVSLILFQNVHQARTEVEPLFYNVHKRHMEEEARHHNYAFLMLDLIEKRNTNWRSLLHRSTDLLLGQIFSTGWVLAELNRFYTVKELRNKNPFFEVLSSTIPLMEKLSIRERAERLFVTSPYVSLMLNTKNHPLTYSAAKKRGAISLPFPNPRMQSTSGEEVA